MSGKGGIGSPLARAARSREAYSSSNGGSPEMKIRLPYLTHRLNGPPVSGTSAAITSLSMVGPCASKGGHPTTSASGRRAGGAKQGNQQPVGGLASLKNRAPNPRNRRAKSSFCQ